MPLRSRRDATGLIPGAGGAPSTVPLLAHLVTLSCLSGLVSSFGWRSEDLRRDARHLPGCYQSIYTLQDDLIGQ